jgi:predicted transposase YdaD
VTGRVSWRLAPDQFLEFGYKLVRVWELPPKMLLTGGIGTLPLAPISNVTEVEVPSVIAAMKHRLDTEIPPQEAREMWASTQILIGLRYPGEMVKHLLRGVHDMEESTTYQEIIEKGVEKGIAKGGILRLRAAVLRGATLRFGPPDPQLKARLDAISDLHQLDNMSDALITGSVKNWAELLNITNQ